MLIPTYEHPLGTTYYGQGLIDSLATAACVSLAKEIRTHTCLHLLYYEHPLGITNYNSLATAACVRLAKELRIHTSSIVSTPGGQPTCAACLDYSVVFRTHMHVYS